MDFSGPVFGNSCFAGDGFMCKKDRHQRRTGAGHGSGSGPPPPPPVEDKAAKAFDMAKSEFLSENIYFAFDKSNLDDMAQATLKKKAEFLKTYPDVYTTIEGNCDERGTAEYNLALGERRAESAKSFLVDMGVEAYRISTVSYGEERPACTEQTEDCWAKNRRDNFIIN